MAPLPDDGENALSGLQNQPVGLISVATLGT